MTALKKGNVFTHAKASGKKVVFTRLVAKKKPAAKKTAVKKTTKRKPARPAARPRATPTAVPKKQYKYSLHVKRTAKGIWSVLFVQG